MNLNITEKLKGQINNAIEEARLKTGEKVVSGPASGNPIPPVLQLNSTPAGIDLSQFENPFGPTNPNGSYLSLYQFSSLANNIPSFTTYYSPGGNNIDTMYMNILNGSNVQPSATFTSSAFYSAKQTFSLSAIGSLTPTPCSWHPVYAAPSDWYSLLKSKTGLFPTTLDLSIPDESFNNQYTIIAENGNMDLEWNQADSNGNVTSTPVSVGAGLNTIKFNFMVVDLTRPWFNLSLFSMNGWYLGGQSAGFLSSGNTNNNTGVFPLYTTSVIIGTDLEISGKLDATENERISTLIAQKTPFSLGPFTIASLKNDIATNSDVLANDGYFIIGWISELVDLSPKVDG